MDINDLASINCDKRNIYDKTFCENLNNSNITDFLKPYNNSPFGINDKDSYFSKNNYFLKENIETINNIPKKDCANNCIEKDYGYNS